MGPYAKQFSKRDLLICCPMNADDSDADASEAKCVNACLLSSFRPHAPLLVHDFCQKACSLRGYYFTFYAFTPYTFIFRLWRGVEKYRSCKWGRGEGVESFLVVHGDPAVHFEEKMRARLLPLMFATASLYRCYGLFCLLFRPSRLVHDPNALQTSTSL